MSEPNRKRPRITEDLALLGKTLNRPTTPQENTPVPQAKSASKIFVRTPGSAARTPTAGSRPTTVRRGKPTTPHAIRALNQRRNAALTPGRDRRRSGRTQRETPRDDLRKLSKVLAKTSKPIEPSPQVTEPRRHSRSVLQDVDDSPALDRAPRLSMALNELDDDSFHENPPRLSYPLDHEDDLEGGRRALFTQRRSRLSLGDPSLGDLNDMGMDDGSDIDEDELRGRDLTDYGMEDDLEDVEADGETGELRALMESRRQSEGAYPTGGSPGTDGEPTFIFTIPERRRTTLVPPQVQQDKSELQGEVDGGAEYNDEWSDVEEAAKKPLRQESIPAVDDGRRTVTKKGGIRIRKELKVSRFGIEYPSMPPTVIKRLASTFSRTYGGSGKLNKETIDSISQASDWFLEQISEDLSSYAEHAGRKTIEESDVITLMKRQRQVNATTTPFSLAQKFLPRELVQEVRMPPINVRKRKRSRMETIEEEDE